MEVIVCKACKKLFKYSHGPELCQCCKDSINSGYDYPFRDSVREVMMEAQEEERQYQEVKEYLLRHPKQNVIQVSNETHVTTKLLLKWVRDGRLMMVENNIKAFDDR